MTALAISLFAVCVFILAGVFVFVLAGGELGRNEVFRKDETDEL